MRKNFCDSCGAELDPKTGWYALSFTQRRMSEKTGVYENVVGADTKDMCGICAKKLRQVMKDEFDRCCWWSQDAEYMTEDQ